VIDLFNGWIGDLGKIDGVNWSETAATSWPWKNGI